MVQTCGYCHEKPRGGLASAYWAWFDLEHKRVAYRIKYCPDDAVKQLAPLLKAWADKSDTDFGTTCLSCGELLENDYSLLYLRLYVPGNEEQAVDGELCPACYAQLIGEISEHGEQLKDRNDFAPARATHAWALVLPSPLAD